MIPYTSTDRCCGCGACVTLCPKHALTLQSDREGFLYPVCDTKLCVNCGICRRICDFKPFVRHKDPLAFAAWHRDPKVRVQSSSGGVFTALSEAILIRGGVIYGAGLDENLEVCHQRADSLDSLIKLRGSKYVQSDLRDTFARIKNDLKTRSVLFVGTPCQCAGLAATFGGHQPDGLILCDLICHGTPSPKIWRAHLNSQHEHVIDYRFRSKVFGWHTHQEEVTFKNGETDHLSARSQLLKQLFYSGLTLRPCCYNCPFASRRRVSDLTLGDFWGIEQSHSEWDSQLGVSLVLTQTAKGHALLKLCDTLEVHEAAIDDSRQPHLSEPAKLPAKRVKFWKDFEKRGYLAAAKRHVNFSYSLRLKGEIKRWLEDFGFWPIL